MKNNNFTRLQTLLNEKEAYYNKSSFIEKDPIAVPHLFSKKQDIEIAGFFASVFAWGNRTTIINKAKELMQLMDNAPYDFVCHHSEKELKRLLSFKHRTFNSDDLFYFIASLKNNYSQHHSLEKAFFPQKGMTVEEALNHFKLQFFSLEHLRRTEKHIASPQQQSSCKRLNMYLRWMVRKDSQGVDFGIWKNISPSQLICPLDLHVVRVAQKLGLLTRTQVDWQAATALTQRLKEFDSTDPVKYDFALFSLGAVEKF